MLAALEEGKIFESRFNYSKGLSDAPLFLLKNDEGIFALVASRNDFDYCRPDVAPAPEEDEADPFDDDDLDFGMF